MAFRAAAFNVSAMAVWKRPEDDAQFTAWARQTAETIAPWSLNGAAYINYMNADEQIDRVRATFGVHAFERLRALKCRFDPNNVLRRNQNVPPPPSAPLGSAT